MFSVGDYIVYGSNGVCQVTDIGPMKLPGMNSDRLYYTMTPCYIKGSSISTPVDNEKVVMRYVMTKEEADSLVSRLRDIARLSIPEEKRREQEYKTALLSCNPEAIVSVIKEIYERMQTRLAEGKKVTSADAKYFHIAEESLYGELAISLGMEKDDVKPYIMEKMGMGEA